MATGDTCYIQFTDASGFLMTLLVTENADGTLTFDLEVDESTGQTGDVRAIFLNNFDDVEYTNLQITSVDPDSDVVLGDVDLVQDINNVRKVVENDTNINGQVLKGNGRPFDTGIEFGKSGIGRNRDDVQSVSFVVSADEPLTLESFDFDSIGLRVTSTGDVEGDRDGSLKLTGEKVIDPAEFATEKDLVSTDEDTPLDFNVLDNDTASTGATLSVIYAGAGAIDFTFDVPFEFMSEGGRAGMLEISQDGSVSFDPAAGFEDLNAGETDQIIFGYAAADTNGNVDGADVVITVDGVDEPEIAPLFVASSHHEPVSLEPRDVLSSSITLVAEKIGTIPGIEGVTNFQSPVAIGQSLYGIDSSGGKIYRVNADGTGKPRLIFDIEDDLPEGLTVDYYEGIANIVGGDANKIYVAFTSDTLPDVTGTPAEDRFTLNELPDFKQPGLVQSELDPNPFDDDIITKEAEDLYRLTPEDVAGFPFFIPKDVGIKYQVIYEFDFAGNKLKNGSPIAAFEVQSSVTGHHGTGMEFTSDGKILWATGDNLPFGLNGREGAQLDDEIPSKLFLIDPETGEIEVAAKGLRNVQHLEIVEDDGVEYLVFADIGGVTSEEVNVVRMDDILDTSEIENFGWGVAEDGLAREGTFYVGGSDNGIAGVLGTQPPATGVAPIGEDGFIQPHAQYGRAGPGSFVASTGPVVSEDSFGDALSMVFGDLASGQLFGTTASLDAIDADVFELNLVDEAGNATSLNELAGDRADPRFFTFADGTAGVLLEETGEYYRLTEQSIFDA